MAHESWTVSNSGIDEDSSLAKRAKKRRVGQRNDNTWIVFGDEKLSDAYPEYQVTLPPGNTVYTCECHTHQYGEYRSKRLCSHVMAVVLYRKGKLPEANRVELHKTTTETTGKAPTAVSPPDGYQAEVDEPPSESGAQLPSAPDSPWWTAKTNP